MRSDRPAERLVVPPSLCDIMVGEADIYAGEDPRELPLYGIGEAAQYLRSFRSRTPGTSDLERAA